jgi:hypothetical protein
MDNRSVAIAPPSGGRLRVTIQRRFAPVRPSCRTSMFGDRPYKLCVIAMADLGDRHAPIWVIAIDRSR